jgi:hypothetical protein
LNLGSNLIGLGNLIANAARTLALRSGRILVAAFLGACLSQSGSGQQKAGLAPSPEFGQIDSAPKAFEVLVILANDALKDDKSIGGSRMSISKGVLSYDLRPVPAASLPDARDRLSSPLEILIRAGALQRDVAIYLPKEEAAVIRTKHLRQVALDIVNAAYSVVDEEAWQSKKRHYEFEAAEDVKSIKRALNDYARDHRLKVLEIDDGSVALKHRSPGSPEGYKVKVRIGPPTVRVKFMPYLTYQKCRAFGESCDSGWNDLSDGSVTLIGRYHYRAEWPPSLSGPAESNFSVYEDKTIIFTPGAK